MLKYVPMFNRGARYYCARVIMKVVSTTLNYPVYKYNIRYIIYLLTYCYGTCIV